MTFLYCSSLKNCYVFLRSSYTKRHGSNFFSNKTIEARLAIWNIQGVSRLVDITAEGDFLGLCDQKSSYKHVSDFGRLRIYGHFLIPVHALLWTASYGTSWRVMYSSWWLIVCGSCNEQLAQFTTERQPVLRPGLAFSKTSFKHRSIRINGNFTKLTLRLYFKSIKYYAGLLFCSVYCQ